MTGKELDLQNDPQVMKLVMDLEAAGAITPVALKLTDPKMKYDTWEALGRFLGKLDRGSRWWVGDWLIFGEALFGEESAQAVEATTAERYSEVERVTGLDHATLMNIRSICSKIPRSRRRKELGFWIHAEVAPLEPDEQREWLKRAIKEGWTRSQLREAIRAAKGVASAASNGSGEGDHETQCQRLGRVGELIWKRGQATTDGSVIVPAEAWAQLGAALGKE